MAQIKTPFEVYLEIGPARTFAVALDWPGWCRSAGAETSALQALCAYGPRYARLLEPAQLIFQPPSDVSDLVVVERLAGNATTNFGAPSLALARDAQPVDPAELERWRRVLHACWGAFDAAAQAAIGRPLTKGPRGGGRELDRIVQHVLDADLSYLASLGGKLGTRGQTSSGEALAQVRQAILATLVAAVNGQIPAYGPRGGVRWSPRYFIRRLAWHDLDHAWELEDRIR